MCLFSRCEKTTATVFSNDILKPHVPHQSDNISKLFFKVIYLSVLFLPDLNIQLSPANSEDSTSCREFDRSFIIIKNRSGEIMEPCVVSISNIYFSDTVLPTLT